MKKINESYFKVDDSMNNNSIEDVLSDGESILWREKPNKKAYIWSCILNPLFPFALIWLLIDVGVLICLISFGFFEQFGTWVIWAATAFFALHMIPIWIWIIGIFTGVKEYKNIEYAFTERRIIIRGGIIGIDFKNIYYTDVKSVNLKVGITDKIFKVGDIYIKANNEAVVLFDIKNPYQISSKLQKITLDIKTDIYYPNALRPDENPGYKTKYKGE